MYKYTDSVIKWINRRIVVLFNSSRRLIKQDELNVIEGSKALYSELMKMLVYAYLKISKRAYRRAGGPDERAISTAWLMKNLRDYDPVTGYVFTREVSRKRDRMAEGIISQRSIDGFLKAERLFCLMAAQYAIEATDNATMQAYQDQGVKKVR